MLRLDGERAAGGGAGTRAARAPRAAARGARRSAGSRRRASRAGPAPRPSRGRCGWSASASRPGPAGCASPPSPPPSRPRCRWRRCPPCQESRWAPIITTSPAAVGARDLGDRVVGHHVVVVEARADVHLHLDVAPLRHQPRQPVVLLGGDHQPGHARVLARLAGPARRSRARSRARGRSAPGWPARPLPSGRCAAASRSGSAGRIASRSRGRRRGVRAVDGQLLQLLLGEPLEHRLLEVGDLARRGDQQHAAGELSLERLEVRLRVRPSRASPRPRTRPRCRASTPWARPRSGTTPAPPPPPTRGRSSSRGRTGPRARGARSGGPIPRGARASIPRRAGPAGSW